MVENSNMPNVPPPPGLQLSSRLANPLDAAPDQDGDFMVAGIFGILTTLCFVALLIIEWLDWNTLSIV